MEHDQKSMPTICNVMNHV